MTRNASFILFAAFVDALGCGIVIPVLPVLLGELTVSRELQAYWYGILAAAFGAMQFLSCPVMGSLSDHYGRRPILLMAIIGLGLDFFLTGAANSVWMLLLARIVGGITAANYSVATAYVADLTQRENRSQAFGRLGMVYGIGLVVSPVFGGLLATSNPRIPFYIAAVLTLLNACYGLMVLPESLPAAKRSKILSIQWNPLKGFFVLWGNKGISTFAAIYAFVMLAQFISQTTWVLFAGFRFGWHAMENGFSIFIVSCCYSVAQAVIGLAIKRIGEMWLLLVSLVSGVFAFALYGLAQAAWMMYAIPIVTLVGFMAAPLLQGAISKRVGESEQGTMMGALAALTSLLSIIGPLAGNFLMGRVSGLPGSDWRIGIDFFICAGLQMIGCLVGVMAALRSDATVAGNATGPKDAALFIS
jgi:MFS transporter, DHA1 family, tetracycline resistance protein